MTAESSRPAKSEMMAIKTSSSIIVKARLVAHRWGWFAFMFRFLAESQRFGTNDFSYRSELSGRPSTDLSEPNCQRSFAARQFFQDVDHGVEEGDDDEADA